MAQMGHPHPRRGIRLLRRRSRLRTGADLHIDSGLVSWGGTEGERPPDLPDTVYVLFPTRERASEKLRTRLFATARTI